MERVTSRIFVMGFILYNKVVQHYMIATRRRGKFAQVFYCSSCAGSNYNKCIFSFFDILILRKFYLLTNSIFLPLKGKKYFILTCYW